MTPRRRVGTPEPAKDPWRERLEQHATDPVPEPHAVPLCRIVEERGAEEVPIFVPGPEQPVGNVERVASIGDRHRGKEPDTSLGQDAAHEGLLLRIDARTHVSDELRDPMHRSAPA